ncbi:MAG: ArsC family reductase [Granulosicoccus sp.]
MEKKVVLYGIANCDTVRKARKWMEAKSIDYEFHDYKKAGIDKEALEKWCKNFGWENLINKRGTTWRKLADEEKSDLTKASAIALMMKNTSVIKRPIVSLDDTWLLGFDEKAWAEAIDPAPQ